MLAMEEHMSEGTGHGIITTTAKQFARHRSHLATTDGRHYYHPGHRALSYLALAGDTHSCQHHTTDVEQRLVELPYRYQWGNPGVYRRGGETSWSVYAAGGCTRVPVVAGSGRSIA